MLIISFLYNYANYTQNVIKTLGSASIFFSLQFASFAGIAQSVD